MSLKFDRSKEQLQYARKVTPWGTQTNAKSFSNEQVGNMPHFVATAKGSHFTDLDGNVFIDYVAALGPIILGYQFPEVDEAVREQMSKGVLYSLASPLEAEVAKLMSQTIPGAERVRFLKTGADANSANVRIARAHTGKNLIASCAYQGWHDWHMVKHGGDVANGIPANLAEHVVDLPYGDLEKAEEIISSRKGDLAAVISVPYEWNQPYSKDWALGLREITQKHGVLLIFDEVLTGFRLAPGGAAEAFGVTPDLASFAKAMANGYPISAICGRADIMSTLEEKRVFITTTYAGDALSLAAAKATIETLKNKPVHRHLEDLGQKLKQGFITQCHKRGLEADINGADVHPFLKLKGKDEFNNRLSELLIQKGVFAPAQFRLMYAHTHADIDATLEAIAWALDTQLANT